MREDRIDIGSFRLCSRLEHTGECSNVLILCGIRFAPMDF